MKENNISLFTPPSHTINRAAKTKIGRVFKNIIIKHLNQE